jgi:hypothetical protein
MPIKNYEEDGKSFYNGIWAETERLPKTSSDIVSAIFNTFLLFKKGWRWNKKSFETWWSVMTLFYQQEDMSRWVRSNQNEKKDAFQDIFRSSFCNFHCFSFVWERLKMRQEES